jgi:hypothetical protein
MTASFVEILQLVIAGVLVAGVRALFGIKDHLAKLNGRMIKSEMWQQQHEKQDDERFTETGKRFDRLDHHLKERE